MFRGSRVGAKHPIKSVCFTRNTGETQGRSDIIILLELRLLRCEIDGGRRLLEPTQRQRLRLLIAGEAARVAAVDDADAGAAGGEDRLAKRLAGAAVALAVRLPILREALVGAPGKLLRRGVEADLRLRDQGEEAGDDGAVQIVVGLGVVLGRLQILREPARRPRRRWRW